MEVIANLFNLFMHIDEQLGSLITSYGTWIYLMLFLVIFCETGLVGKVIATSSHFAIGQIVLNKDFRVSAKVQRSRIVGIISWDGGETLRLNNVAKKQDVQEGDVVLTSEYSNIFPRDIRIGTVTKVTDKPGSLFKDVEVEPSVNFATLEEVFVVSMVPDTERASLEKNAIHVR